MAEDLDECEFVICESEECREKFKKDVLIINKNEINYYSNYNKSDNLNEINIDNLYSFYLKFSFVNGGDLNQNSLKYILSESKPTFIYFRNKSTNIWEKEFNEIVEKYKEKFIFLSSDIEGKEAYLNAAYILRIKKRDLPSVFLFDNLNKDEANKFKYNKESLSMENFEKFLEEYKNEKIKEVIDSEEIPDESKQIYNYRIIVGKSFETEVINYKENVLLFSFGEDCEMCEKYLKDFDNLAKKYKEENIKFTIINLDENEIKNIYPSKYPSIYLFKKENKNEPILFEMEFEKLEYWIKNTLNIGKDEINDEL
jgi:thiol-disulfide isomerase/thioredoxin